MELSMKILGFPGNARTDSRRSCKFLGNLWIGQWKSKGFSKPDVPTPPVQTLCVLRVGGGVLRGGFPPEMVCQNPHTILGFVLSRFSPWAVPNPFTILHSKGWSECLFDLVLILWAFPIWWRHSLVWWSSLSLSQCCSSQRLAGPYECVTYNSLLFIQPPRNRHLMVGYLDLAGVGTKIMREDGGSLAG